MLPKKIFVTCGDDIYRPEGLDEAEWENSGAWCETLTVIRMYPTNEPDKPYWDIYMRVGNDLKWICFSNDPTKIEVVKLVRMIGRVPADSDMVVRILAYEPIDRSDGM